MANIVSLNDKKNLNLVCSMFMPVFEPTKILFAGKIYLNQINHY